MPRVESNSENKYTFFVERRYELSDDVIPAFTCTEYDPGNRKFANYWIKSRRKRLGWGLIVTYYLFRYVRHKYSAVIREEHGQP